MQEKLLSVTNLSTSFRLGGEYYAAVDGISFDLHKNEILALVGESGCGKSATALSITNLHNPNYTRIKGKIDFNGKNLLALSEKELNKIRGKDITMVFQDPLTSLNPLFRVGPQIEEPLRYHSKLTKSQMKERAIQLLTDVGMTNPQLTYSSFPHELSGGMRQRAMIAIALACSPSLIIADEPTTALDVTIQAQILSLMLKLKERTGASIILITHDLGVVAEMADRVAVMYAGEIVEHASCVEILKNPMHPYTRSLLSSIPGKKGGLLQTIQGAVPSLKNLPRSGCRFSPRIPWIEDGAHEENPALKEVSPDHFVRCSCYKSFRFQYSET